MLITKSEGVTKQGFCKVLWRKLRLREGLLLSLIGVLWEGVGWGGRLFEAGRLLTFSAFGMGAYSRWALIRGWALNRINTVRRYYLRSNDGKLLNIPSCKSDLFPCLVIDLFIWLPLNYGTIFPFLLEIYLQLMLLRRLLKLIYFRRRFLANLLFLFFFFPLV